jgi:hypothetical protein
MEVKRSTRDTRFSGFKEAGIDHGEALTATCFLTIIDYWCGVRSPTEILLEFRVSRRLGAGQTSFHLG